MIEQIEEKIISYRHEMVDMLCYLIAFDTANPPGRSYVKCVDYLSGKLREWNIQHDIITVPNGDFPRFSIVGTCGIDGEGIHLHGHYDVVPPNSKAQYIPRIEKNCLYGRGSSDMKSGLVVLLYALRIINECKVDLKEKITFSIVPDEETGGILGTKYLFDSGMLPMSKGGMLMPEPTSGVIWNANKGALTCKVTIKGKAAHVGLEHRGGNAFEKMLEIAGELKAFKKKVTKRKTTLPVSPSEANRSVMLMGGESGSGANFNVVPAEAFFTIDRRFNPEENLDEVKQELLDIINSYKNKKYDVEIEMIQEGESSEMDTESKVASALEQSIFEVTGHEPTFGLCPGVCEIRFFNSQGIPAYAYGPGLLEVAHGPEECVPIQNMIDCTKIYALSVIRSIASF